MKSDGPVKLLFATRIYWPDTHLMRTLASRLAASGVDVRILTQQPTQKSVNLGQRYPAREVDLGIHVRRLAPTPGAGRIGLLTKLDMALFPVKLVGAMILRRLKGDTPDYIAVQTMPPVLMGMSAALAARIAGARMIYHFMDIYPELAGVFGMIKPGSLSYRLAQRLDMLNIRMAHRCIVLTEEMADVLVARGAPREKMVIINNFVADATGDTPATVPPEYARRDGIHRVIFAGNLGRFQHLDAVLDAARRVCAARPDIEVVFMGGGVMQEQVRAAAEAEPGIHYIPHQSVDQANAIVATASLGIVSLVPGIYRYAFPSKTFTYMALGIPVLAVVERDGDLARLVEEDGIGLCARDHSAEAIADALIEAIDSGLTAEKIGERIRSVYESGYRVDTVAAKWVAMLEDDREAGQ